MKRLSQSRWLIDVTKMKIRCDWKSLSCSETLIKNNSTKTGLSASKCENMVKNLIGSPSS